MTCGIYALYWEEQDLLYVGQSIDIESRFKTHLRAMQCNNHSNYKVQQAYMLYEVPQLHILEVCKVNHLNILEIQWTKEFNSLNSINGLNIIEAGGVGWGPYTPNSKFSLQQILKVFNILCINTFSYKEIQSITGVSISTIRDIALGKNHRWLKEKYTDKYTSMLKKVSLKSKTRILNSFTDNDTSEVLFGNII